MPDARSRWGAPGHPTSSPAAPYNGTIVQNLADTTLGMWERMARDQQGYATTNALLAVIAGLGQLPGRKTVVFFAEALSLPDAVMPQFNAVIAAANRANVAVYSVDSQGLRVHSEDQTTGSEINAIGTHGDDRHAQRGNPVEVFGRWKAWRTCFARTRAPACRCSRTRRADS